MHRHECYYPGVLVLVTDPVGRVAVDEVNYSAES